MAILCFGFGGGKVIRNNLEILYLKKKLSQLSLLVVDSKMFKMHLYNLQNHYEERFKYN